MTRRYYEPDHSMNLARIQDLPQKKIDEIQISLQTPNMVTEGVACEGLKDKRKRPLT